LNPASETISSPLTLLAVEAEAEAASYLDGSLCSSCYAMLSTLSQSHLPFSSTTSSLCGCKCQPPVHPLPLYPRAVKVAFLGKRRRGYQNACKVTLPSPSAPAFYARSNEAWAPELFEPCRLLGTRPFHRQMLFDLAVQSQQQHGLAC
jgi:hypothetical protein